MVATRSPDGITVTPSSLSLVLYANFGDVWQHLLSGADVHSPHSMCNRLIGLVASDLPIGDNKHALINSFAFTGTCCVGNGGWSVNVVFCQQSIRPLCPSLSDRYKITLNNYLCAHSMSEFFSSILTSGELLKLMFLYHIIRLKQWAN